MKIIVSPEVWLEATRSLGSPAAKLMMPLIGDPKLKDEHQLVACQWVGGTLAQMMMGSGYQKEQADDQGKFILDLSDVFDIPDDAERPLVALAKAAGVDTVYYVGGSYEDADGIHFAPVHELMTTLGLST